MVSPLVLLLILVCILASHDPSLLVAAVVPAVPVPNAALVAASNRQPLTEPNLFSPLVLLLTLICIIGTLIVEVGHHVLPRDCQ